MSRKANYDKEPAVAVAGFDNHAWQGYAEIAAQIASDIDKRKIKDGVVVVDCYPGVRISEIVDGLKTGVDFSKVIISDYAAKSGDEITEMIERNLTDDRVFGVISHHNMDEFYNAMALSNMKASIADEKGLVLVIGVGASLVTEGDILVYADLARWEIQARYRSGEFGNWQMDNYEEDILRKYKRGFFVEWRVADRHKRKLFDRIDYLLDTNVKDTPKMITGDAFTSGLDLCANRPFRLVPFFDAGVWGGQWMKEVCDLDKASPNYAWCFDCVPEENSLYLQYGDVRVEVPSIDLVFYRPVALLGDKVHARFGAEFPIRFDFLDTIEGQNLSLQVHPLTEYIQETFGMHYTQDESYYMLDTAEDTSVYLGIKDGVKPEEMIDALREAQKGEKPFDAENYVNKIPAKKHDHFLIPAGTVHCSGAGSMVLEISATPYIFTFKLWDWGRLGMDGLPRPVHIEHGKEVVQFDRDTEWTMKNLVNRVEEVASGDGWIEERTGLHEREFIETRRHWFTEQVLHHTDGSVNVLNLIEGDEALVESPTGAFEPYVVHYAETFVIPDAVGAYTIKPYGASEGKKIATLKAFVRQ